MLVPAGKHLLRGCSYRQVSIAAYVAHVLISRYADAPCLCLEPLTHALPLPRRWTKLLPRGNKPAPRAFHTACSLVHSSKIFIFGGQNGTATLNDLYELDLESLTWTFVQTRSVPCLSLAILEAPNHCRYKTP